MGPRVGGVARGKLLCRGGGLFAKHVGGRTRRPRYCLVSKGRRQSADSHSQSDWTGSRWRVKTALSEQGLAVGDCRRHTVQQDVVWWPGQETQAK